MIIFNDNLEEILKKDAEYFNFLNLKRREQSQCSRYLLQIHNSYILTTWPTCWL